MRSRTVAIGAGVQALAAALVVGVLLLRPDGGNDTVVPPVPTTTVPPGPTTTAAETSTNRRPTDLAVRLLADGGVRVTWKPPADRNGLTGYVVLHAPKGRETETQQVIVGTTAVEAVVNVPAPGSRCFVVAAVYGPKQEAPGSDRACT